MKFKNIAIRYGLDNPSILALGLITFLQWVVGLFLGVNASHKSNPSSIPWGIVDSYPTLPWVTWEAVIVVEGIR
jgi:hypothetical protein